jgi:protein-S-isoprenylcysteine O-methyltransferase Ste14
VKSGAHLVHLGGWLFKHRTAIPVPIALVLLFVKMGQLPRSSWLAVAGVSVVATGEWIRLWAVRHIGKISRTRADRLGPLVTTGPFALVRNPLYIGNLVLWVGFALSARLAWMVLLIVPLIGFEYHAIVRWEEGLLAARRGRDYQTYLSQVPRWFPAWRSGGTAAASFSWLETLHSERGTLIAIAVGYMLLWLKDRVMGF